MDNELVKSQKPCHSRGGWSQELLNITGFPPPRE
jgi:hypothetical protein